jgi:RNA polymerase sigma-70 factor (ECF subfamily)
MSAGLDAVYLSERRSLLWSALRIVRDPQIAEDVAQESYLRAHRAIEKAPIENISAFLHRTARNLALDHVRRARVQARVLARGAEAGAALEVAADLPSAEDRLLHRERVAQFRVALDRLPDRARQVWLLSRVHGWPYPRIAAHLGVSPGTVFNDMKHAMGHLADALAREERR